jgi:cell fate (sporulation/competence/biofilm development) regulator YlbF (YheA/YmcA/DUF963 family)
MNDLKPTLPGHVLETLDVLAENLLQTQPVLRYQEARARLYADSAALLLLDRFSAAQLDVREGQAQGAATLTELDNLRVLQEETHANATIMDYARAQQEAMAYLPEVNREISQLLAVDFALLARRKNC